MKGMKKLLSIILCLTMVLTMGMMTIPAFAAEDIQTAAESGTIQFYYWSFTDNAWVKYGDPISGTAGSMVSASTYKTTLTAFMTDKNDLFGLHGATFSGISEDKGTYYAVKTSNVYFGTYANNKWTFTSVNTQTTAGNVNQNFKYSATETPVLVYPTTADIPVKVVNGSTTTWKTDTKVTATLAKPTAKKGTSGSSLNEFSPSVYIKTNTTKLNGIDFSDLKLTNAQNVIFRDNDGNIIYDIASMKYNKIFGSSSLTSYTTFFDYPWLFNVTASIESKFPLTITIPVGTSEVVFKALDENAHEVLFEIGKEIDLSAYKFSSDGKTKYTISELISSISNKEDKLRGYKITRIYNGGNQDGNLISGNTVKFTITDNDADKYLTNGTIALTAAIDFIQYEIKVMYCTEEFPETYKNTKGVIQPICDSILVSKSMTYDSKAQLSIIDAGLTVESELGYFDQAQKAVTGWTVDATATKATKVSMSSIANKLDADGGYTFNIVYTHDKIPAYLDYNTDYENQKEKTIEEIGHGYSYHGQNLYEDSSYGLITHDVDIISFATADTYTLDDDGNVKEDIKANGSTKKPGRDYEYIGYEVYFYEGTLTADQVANVDYSKLEPVSKDADGKLQAKAGTTIIVRLLWKNDNDFILKIYNTKGDLSIAVGKNLKTYYWANNKPCKRSEIIKVENPDKNYVCMYVPGTEQTHRVLQEGVMNTTENTKKVFTLTMAMGTKSNLTIEGRFAFYKTLIDTIKSLIG